MTDQRDDVYQTETLFKIIEKSIIDWSNPGSATPLQSMLLVFSYGEFSKCPNDIPYALHEVLPANSP